MKNDTNPSTTPENPGLNLVIEQEKDKNIYHITFPSKTRVTVDAEENGVSLQTNDGNTIEFNGKGITLQDKNKNKIVMDNTGITIESARDLMLKARMNVVIDAGYKLEAKAKSDVALDGININANAKANLRMKGTTLAELSAMGQTVVKGVLVAIN